MGGKLRPQPEDGAMAPAAPPAAAAGGHVPKLSAGQLDELLPDYPPEPEFLFAWHPLQWTVVAGRVVPRLRTIVLRDGVNNVRRNRQGEWVLGTLMAQLRDRGWKTVPWEWAPDGTSYMRRVKVQRGVAYLPVWQQVFSGSKHHRTDEAGFAAWLASLVEAGKIPPCPLHVLERLQASTETRLAQLQAAAKTSPVLEREAQITAGVLEAITKQLAEVPAAVEGTAAVPKLNTDEDADG